MSRPKVFQIPLCCQQNPLIFYMCQVTVCRWQLFTCSVRKFSYLFIAECCAGERGNFYEH